MRLKAILIALVVALIAIAGGGVILVLSMDFNRYKGLISERVKLATGRDLTIGGDFKLVLSLTPSFAVDNVSFANMPGGSRSQMLSLKRLEVQLELLPLLSRQIKVDRLVLEGAAILLETDKTGRANWVFGKAGTPGSPEESGTGMQLPQVGLVQVQDSLLTYRDGITGTIRSLRIDKLDAKSASGRVDLELLARVREAPISVRGYAGAPELLAAGAPYPFDLAMKSGEFVATAKGTIGDLARMREVAVDFSAKGKSLSDLDELVDAALPRVGPYELRGRLTDARGSYAARGLSLRLGGSSATAELTFLPGSRSKVTANLAAQRIDLRDFGIEPSGSGPRSSAGDGRVFPATPLPFALLNKVDADVKLTARQLIKAPITLSNVNLSMGLAAGKLLVKPFSAGIGGGTLVFNLTVDGARRPVPVALDLTETDAEAGTLLQVVAGISVLSGGRSNVKINVASAGDSVRAIMAGLNGRFDYAMGAGNINNDYARIFLADLFTLFSFGSSGDRSNLKCAVARFDISRGLASARQLVIETRGATIIGKGTVNLATEGLDLHMAPYATSTNLSTLAIPMTIRGTIANPRVNPDTAAIPGHTVGAVVTAPLTVLSTIGNVVGIGSSGEGALCGASTPAAPGTTSQAPQQSTSPIEGLLNGVGSGAKDASDALKGLLP